jgi:type IX secretion system PorP/SprF family membrane protein
MRSIFRILFFLLVVKTAFSQELPINSQIFLNPYYYNPAYAGFEDRPAFYVYRRQQWTGISGAPVTTGFNFHTVFNEKINFGINIMNDQRSILNTSRALITFGYRAGFDEFHYLSFGLSGGVGFNNIDLDAIDSNDPAIAEVLDNNIFLDGNAGISYYNNGFHMGVSLPRIFKTKTLSATSFTQGEISPLNNAIGMMSYKWQISEDKLAFEPFLLYHYSKDMPGQFEATGLLHFMNAIWVGGSYRQDYGITAFVGINIKDNFKFGYAYEFFDVAPAVFNNNTHDLQLALIFGEKKKKGKVNLIQQRRNMLRSMGRLPSEQEQKTYPVENDPFVEEEPEETVETYTEEDALQDLLNEINEPEPEIETEPEETVETYTDEDALQDLLNEINEPEPEPEPEIETEPEPEEIDEEDELIMQMEEEPEEEITFDALEELTEEDQIEDLLEDVDATDEFIEPTLDDAGKYIGPTTVMKGDHLLELEQGNYVVVGTFGSYREAEEYSDKLFIQGFYTKFGYISQTKIYYVYIFESDNLQETKDTSDRFGQIGAQFNENWVLQVQ